MTEAKLATPAMPTAPGAPSSPVATDPLVAALHAMVAAGPVAMPPPPQNRAQRRAKAKRKPR